MARKYGPKEPAQKRIRLRAVTADHVGQHGIDRLHLGKLARAAGMDHGIARWHYRTNQALLLDTARTHYEQLGHALADSILDADALPPDQRLQHLVAAMMNALIEAGPWHRTAMTAIAAYPAIAQELRNVDAWITDELADNLPEPSRYFRARALLTLIDHAALWLHDADAEVRAACAEMLVRMAAAPHPPG